MKKLILAFALFTGVLVSAKSIEPNYLISSSHSYYLTNVNSFCKEIQMGNYEMVETLINEGVDVNKKSTGLTPLMFAARHNKAKIAALLIKNGARLKTKSDRNGITALEFAELSNAKDAYEVINKALIEAKKNKKKRR